MYVYKDGKGLFHMPDYPYYEKYLNATLRIGSWMLRILGLEKKNSYNSPFGYYKGKSYYPSLMDLKIHNDRYVCYIKK
ncbi:MAG: hypothetical protein J7L45_03345 [Candidatus Aenigmarchaeota archaeon]|nr:hypothetical protein [Candidatus Aenigmarchaeota archaeon]